jgi:hypothetical protein
MKDGTTSNIATTYPPGPIDPGSAAGDNNIGKQQDHYMAAYELMQKLFCGEQTFYLPGFRVQWTQFFWMPQPLDPGGIIEDPITSGRLPYFYWSTNNPQDSNTAFNIFALMAARCPQLYDPLKTGKTVISWLRLCDMPVVWERTWFGITRTWLGGPYSHWDKHLYTNAPSPYPPPPQDPLLASGPF